jgi:hypothetical protein
MPVILDTQEAEIKKIMVQGQPISKNLHKKGLVEWLKCRSVFKPQYHKNK